MGTTSWAEDPPGAREPEAACRGCGAPLWRLTSALGELWEDAAGVTVCVKLEMATVGRGFLPDFVYHVPMPSGLRGGLEP